MQTACLGLHSLFFSSGTTLVPFFWYYFSKHCSQM